MRAVPIAASAASPTAPAPTLTAVLVTLIAAPATAHPLKAAVQTNAASKAIREASCNRLCRAAGLAP
jgi:hypothetical protein